MRKADRPKLEQISFHYVLSFSHGGYSRGGASIGNTGGKFTLSSGKLPYQKGIPVEHHDTVKENRSAALERKANVTIVSFARSGGIDGVVFSMKQVEVGSSKRYGCF